ncbi:hypothetical protein AB0F71_39305 [Kitasatospora sp. NPDC028055]|uniref:hypothetical protein n=1 Tax=Kitasatospora sp. NPDC028055 TaxID=3155653 RepID=UPI0033C7F112
MRTACAGLRWAGETVDASENCTIPSALAGAIGRSWTALDPGEASTVEVARMTRLDEVVPL